MQAWIAKNLRLTRELSAAAEAQAVGQRCHPARTIAQASVQSPPTAAESMTIAAEAMSDALSTALTLVAHANDQA